MKNCQSISYSGADANATGTLRPVCGLKVAARKGSRGLQSLAPGLVGVEFQKDSVARLPAGRMGRRCGDAGDSGHMRKTLGAHALTVSRRTLAVRIASILRPAGKGGHRASGPGA